MRTAYFDVDGVCVLITNVLSLDYNYPYIAEVPDEGKPSDFWYNVEIETYEKTLEVDNLVDLLGVSATVPTSQPINFEIPACCVLEINGIRFKGINSLSFDNPTQILFRLLGKQVGECIVNVNSYVENRLHAYPSMQEQLDMLYHLGYDEWRAVITQIKEQFPKQNSE